MANPNIKARLEKLERTNPKAERLALLSDAELGAAIAGLRTILDGDMSGTRAEWPEVAQAMALHNVAFSQPQFEALCHDLLGVSA